MPSPTFGNVSASGFASDFHTELGLSKVEYYVAAAMQGLVSAQATPPDATATATAAVSYAQALATALGNQTIT